MLFVVDLFIFCLVVCLGALFVCLFVFLFVCCFFFGGGRGVCVFLCVCVWGGGVRGEGAGEGCSCMRSGVKEL